MEEVHRVILVVVVQERQVKDLLEVLVLHYREQRFRVAVVVQCRSRARHFAAIVGHAAPAHSVWLGSDPTR